MQKYLFIGQSNRFYPAIIVPGEGSLYAHPGDLCSFEEGQAPTDGCWVEVPEDFIRNPLPQEIARQENAAAEAAAEGTPALVLTSHPFASEHTPIES